MYELAKEIGSKSKESLSIEILFNLLFKITPIYIDYYESDLGEFLTEKSKRYYLFISLRILTILGYIISLSLFTFLETSSISTVSGLITISLFPIFFYLDRIINRKYKYTTKFFQGTGKKLIIFMNKLNLLLNNSHLSEKYSSDKYDFEMIKANSKKLKNRIDNDIGIIKPSSYYLKKFALPTILFAPIITFFINLVYNLVQNPITFNVDVIIDFLLGLFFFLLIFYQHINAIRRIKVSRKNRETSVYTFYEIMVFMILEAIRLKLRIMQFPQEEKFTRALLNASEKIIERFKQSSNQEWV